MIQFYVVFSSECGVVIFGILIFLIYSNSCTNFFPFAYFYWVKRWMDGCLGEFLLYIYTVLYNCNHVCVFLRRTSGAKGRER